MKLLRLILHLNMDLRPEDIEMFEQTLAISELLPIPYYKGYEN